MIAEEEQISIAFIAPIHAHFTFLMPHYMTEINVEKVAISCEHKIIIMPITKS
jgi:hypothetical protein